MIEPGIAASIAAEVLHYLGGRHLESRHTHAGRCRFVLPGLLQGWARSPAGGSMLVLPKLPMRPTAEKAADNFVHKQSLLIIIHPLA